MYQNYCLDLAKIVLISIIIGFLLTPISIWIAKKLDIIDYPSKSTHSIHTKPTPRSGGIVIILALLIVVSLNGFWKLEEFKTILLPSTIVFVFGIWDDRFGMDAPIKLIGQVIACSVLLYLGTRVMFLENSSFFIHMPTQIALALDILITYVWVIGITNAINMIDSIDGLANGICQIISAFFILLLVISEQINLAYLVSCIYGISKGLSFFNERPAKIFLGDSGAQILGFVLSAIAIAYHPQEASQASTWFAPVLFFSIPILDTTLVTLSRIHQRIPFYKANLDHTYHRLIKLGWVENKAIAIIHLVQVIFCLVSVCSLYLEPFDANLIFFIWVVVFGVMLYLLGKVNTLYEKIKPR